MKLLTLAALAAIALIGTAKDKITFVPGHCVIADDFLKPCPASKRGGFDCPSVHISIKALPDCRQYDHQRILQVPR